MHNAKHVPTEQIFLDRGDPEDVPRPTNCRPEFRPACDARRQRCGVPLVYVVAILLQSERRHLRTDNVIPSYEIPENQLHQVQTMRLHHSIPLFDPDATLEMHSSVHYREQRRQLNRASFLEVPE